MKSADKETLKKHALYWTVLAFIFGIEFACRKPLYDASITLQEALQENITTAGIYVFRALSIWGDGVPYYLTFILLLNWEARPRPYYYLLLLTSTMLVMNTTKMGYHEPRPFMYSEKIKVYGCSSEYGNPSGHSLFSASFNFFIYLDMFHANYGNKKFSKVAQYICLSISISLTFLIGFARFYTGVHTINQIIYGWMWGLWLAFYFHFCIREPLQSHLADIIVEGKQKDKEIQYKKYIIIATLLFITAFLIQIVTYIIVEETFTPDPIWIQRIGEKCNKDVATDKQILNYKSVVYSGIPPVSYAAYLGILLHRYLYGPMKPHCYKTNLQKYIARLLIIGLIAVPFVLCFYFIPWTSGLVILILFKTLIPFLICGFLAFGFSHKIFEKLNLLNQRDLVEASDSINDKDTEKGQP